MSDTFVYGSKQSLTKSILDMLLETKLAIIFDPLLPDLYFYILRESNVYD